MTGSPHEDGPQGPQFHAQQHVEGERRPLRRFSEGRGRKEAEHLDSGVPLAASLVSLGAGVVWAGMGAAFRGWSAPVALAVVFGIWGLGYLIIRVILGASTKAAGGLYNPSGATTPREQEYSYEESLVARGQYEEAATAFELALHDNPQDPKPYLRLARILRDKLERYEDAARWLRRAQRETVMAPGQAFLARKELVELYWHKMGDPTKAAPDLARMAEELAGTPEGEWASKELKEVKRIIAERGEFG